VVLYIRLGSAVPFSPKFAWFRVENLGAELDVPLVAEGGSRSFEHAEVDAVYTGPRAYCVPPDSWLPDK
jgi:hypothetical protein